MAASLACRCWPQQMSRNKPGECEMSVWHPNAIKSACVIPLQRYDSTSPHLRELSQECLRRISVVMRGAVSALRPEGRQPMPEPALKRCQMSAQTSCQITDGSISADQSWPLDLSHSRSISMMWHAVYRSCRSSCGSCPTDLSKMQVQQCSSMLSRA